jgi:hypothetical protein
MTIFVALESHFHSLDAAEIFIARNARPPLIHKRSLPERRVRSHH